MMREKKGADRAAAELAMALASYSLEVPVAGIRDEARGTRPAAFARQTAMYLCHVACGMSLSRVGRAFRRDRSTVSHACHVIEDRREDPRFDAWLEGMEACLRLAPGAGPQRVAA